MGASYHWGFLFETFHAFSLCWPRATDLALQILGVVPSDILIAWRKDENNWIRYKKMVHDLAHFLANWVEKENPSACADQIRAQVLDRWVKMGLMSQKVCLDILSRREHDWRAPIKEGLAKLYTAEQAQLLMVFDSEEV
jgi:hypothetical protein